MFAACSIFFAVTLCVTLVYSLCASIEHRTFCLSTILKTEILVAGSCHIPFHLPQSFRSHSLSLSRSRSLSSTQLMEMWQSSCNLNFIIVIEFIMMRSSLV